ncbi:MAG: TatD family hydrolase [Olegusella sp.]|nr:TatD family hydrolase [Olegusella sp.]
MTRKPLGSNHIGPEDFILEDGSLFHDKKNRPVQVPVAPAPLADTHGHLLPLKCDPAEALARAAEAGVRLLVSPVDPTDDVPDVPAFTDWWGRLADGAPPEIGHLRYIAGVHPYGAKTLMEDPAAQARLDALLDDPRCIGVGEIGLDFGPWNELPADVQERAFRYQLAIARDRDMPVELHIRDGKEDTLAHDMAARILREEGVPRAGCDMHCFTSGPEVMAPFVEMGCHIAFGGAATFKRSDDIRAAFLACPDELVLSETDSPYMAPVPLRGMPCEPAMVALTVAQLAELRTPDDPARTYRLLWDNALGFFGIE